MNIVGIFCSSAVKQNMNSLCCGKLSLLFRYTSISPLYYCANYHHCCFQGRNHTMYKVAAKHVNMCISEQVVVSATEATTPTGGCGAPPTEHGGSIPPTEHVGGGLPPPLTTGRDRMDRNTHHT